MALQIVWRNPKPQVKTAQTVLRIRCDESSAVYVVSNPGNDGTHEFSLISGKAA